MSVSDAYPEKPADAEPTELQRENEDLRRQLEAANSTISALDESQLDLEEALEKLQGQHDVLENFVFALEGEHEKAHRVIEQTQAELVQSYNQLHELKEEQDDILASVGQGILTINSDGLFNAQYSAHAEMIFNRSDFAQITIYDLFAGQQEICENLRKMIDVMFNCPWADATIAQRLNPLTSISYRDPRNPERELMLSFRFAKIMQAGGDPTVAPRVLKLLVVIDDQTREHVLNAALAHKSREYESKLEQIFQISMLPREAFAGFADEAEGMLESVAAHLKAMRRAGIADQQMVDECVKLAHSLKGNARVLNLDAIATMAHRLEEDLLGLKRGGVLDERVVEERLTDLRAEIENGASAADKIFNPRTLFRHSASLGREMERTLSGLIRIETERSNRDVELRYQSDLQEVVLPKAMGTKLRNVLLQLVRNTIAHGIEDDLVRRALGKPEKGLIDVSISRRTTSTGEVLEIDYRDDGRGVDPKLVCSAAVDQALITAEQAKAIKPAEAQRLIFEIGLSTNPRADMLSGRGVGMSVVMDNLAALGGDIQLESVQDRFTRFIMKVPLP